MVPEIVMGAGYRIKMEIPHCMGHQPVAHYTTLLSKVGM